MKQETLPLFGLIKLYFEFESTKFRIQRLFASSGIIHGVIIPEVDGTLRIGSQGGRGCVSGAVKRSITTMDGA